MKLTLDGLEVNPADYEAHTLSGLIQTVERRLSPKRVIVSMNLDGKPLDQDQEAARAAEDLQSIECLDINTQNVAELARNTLFTLSDFQPRLIKMVEQCTMFLQGADEIEGYNILNSLIEGLQMVTSAWKGIAQTLVIPTMEPKEVLPDIEALNSTLNKMADVQESGDLVMLCDLMEFELLPIIETWQEKAEKMKELIQQ
ncbi:MAG: hypothetical protein U9P14_10030 [Gemmatimonadota bacterium]|nr:hypothetical protein [Gemmatimonadota bacterium]